MHNVWNDWVQILLDLDDLEWGLFGRGDYERASCCQKSIYYIQRDYKGKPIVKSRRQSK